MRKIIKGDLIDLAMLGQFDVIIHGCNCFCSMDAGIAKTIKKIFPEAYSADYETQKGSRQKMGTISFAEIQYQQRTIVVVNGYTQYHWEGAGVLVDYAAVRSVMNDVKKKFGGKRIGYPLIGAGLAKGDWEIISKIIVEELREENHYLVLRS